MSRSLVSSSRQSPSPAPVLPVSPLSALPSSRSYELNCCASRASSASVTGSYDQDVLSNASMRTSPATSDRLTTRTKPWRYGSAADGNSGARCIPPDAWAGVVDKFVRWPVGLETRLITSTRDEDSISTRHLPSPSPSAPSSPGAIPDSSSAAEYVLAWPGGISILTADPGVEPASSVPRMVTAIVSAPGLTSRSRPLWLMLLPGLKVAMR